MARSPSGNGTDPKSLIVPDPKVAPFNGGGGGGGGGGGSPNDLGSLDNQPVQRSSFLLIEDLDDIYEFDITGSPSSTLAAEEDFGYSLSGDAAAVETGYISNDNTSDTYAVSVVDGEVIDITLSGLSSNADLRAIQDSNDNNVVDPNEVYRTSTNLGASSENISLDQEGDYFVEVYQFSGSTDYTLQFDQEFV